MNDGNDLIILASSYLWYGVTCLVLWSVFAQLTRITHWTVRAFDFPMRQLLIAECIASSFFLWMHWNDIKTVDGIILGLAFLGSFYLTYCIWPYSFLHKKDVTDSKKERSHRSISILSANVYMYNQEYQKLSLLIEECNPDIILLLETNQKWANAMAYLKEQYPYAVEYPLENTYGMLLFSKIVMKDTEVRFLLKEEIPSIKLDLVIDNKREVRFYGVHPEPPAPGESETSEPRDIELLKLAKEIRQMDSPVIVTGDLNDVAWSHTTRLFRRFSGLLDPRIGRGAFNTFHAKYPFLRWPLDHVFISGHFKLRSLKVCKEIGSDHFPIFISLDLEDEIHQEVPKADSLDKKEVKDILTSSMNRGI
jgi:endonuclease/exonuclease/phosphatase (EEP) superfamily protein YafD